MPERLRIAVGMSGGVDSTAAAWLLKKQGHEVFGVTMLVWDGERGGCGGPGGCYGSDEQEEAGRAARFADKLGIKHISLDLRGDYGKIVLDYFRDEYLAGRTPNPCVRCNRFVKLGVMVERAEQALGGFDFFATGHYARIERGERFCVLRRGADTRKDQSYFLWGLSQKQLARLMFPLGALDKARTRELAREAGLDEAAALAESQDFIGGSDYGALFRPGESRPGPLLATDGSVLGEHRGIIHYTLGQRKGIGVGGLGEPLYVVAIDAARNAVVVGPRKLLMSGTIMLRELNLSPAACFDGPLRAHVKIRQQHAPAPALLRPPEDGRMKVEFDSPQFAPTPGQSAVFYDGDAVLGGGIIAEVL